MGMKHAHVKHARAVKRRANDAAGRAGIIYEYTLPDDPGETLQGQWGFLMRRAYGGACKEVCIERMGGRK